MQLLINGAPTSLPEAATVSALAGGLQRLLNGGVYYLPPAYLAGWTEEG